MPRWDAIIAGQGLAGTTLAWHLRAAGKRVLIVDRADEVTTSKIAAGLVTPITGQRIALSWRVGEFLPKAQEFYRSIEEITGEKFYHERPSIRLFGNEIEQQRWEKRKSDAAFQTYVTDPQPSPLLDEAIFNLPGGGFEMDAAQLDVAKFLAASRQVFAADGCVETAEINWENEVHLSPSEATWRDHTAPILISCEGFAATRNPHFSWVKFKAAKGEILTLQFDQPVAPRCIHRGIWLAPTVDPTIWRVGSTYDWHQLDQTPTEEGRQSIEARLGELIRIPWKVLKHQAGVRPIIHESKALLGIHPTKPTLGYFNGLGSKGSLHAPWFAAAFAEFLVNGTELEDAIDLRGNS